MTEMFQRKKSSSAVNKELIVLSQCACWEFPSRWKTRVLIDLNLVKSKKYQTSIQWLETMQLRLKFQSCFLSGDNQEGRRGLEQPVWPGEDSVLPQCPSGQGQVGERFGDVQTNSWVEVVVKVTNLKSLPLKVPQRNVGIAIIFKVSAKTTDQKP